MFDQHFEKGDIVHVVLIMSKTISTHAYAVIQSVNYEEKEISVSFDNLDSEITISSTDETMIVRHCTIQEVSEYKENLSAKIKFLQTIFKQCRNK